MKKVMTPFGFESTACDVLRGIDLSRHRTPEVHRRPEDPGRAPQVCGAGSGNLGIPGCLPASRGNRRALLRGRQRSRHPDRRPWHSTETVRSSGMLTGQM